MTNLVSALATTVKKIEKFTRRVDAQFAENFRKSPRMATISAIMKFQSLEKTRPDISNHWKITAPKRRSVPQLLAMMTVFAAGIFSRSHFTATVSPIVTKAVGDALWATLFFLAIGFLWPRASTKRVALATFAFSTAIEFSQIYHAGWIDRIRSTYIGYGILGYGFHAADFIWYAAGMLLGVAIDVLISRKDR